MEAARHWAAEKRARPDMDVWPENWPVIELFLACSTQWVVVNGGVIGLNYPGVDVVIQRAGLEIGADTWQGLQVMEDAAVAEFHRQAEIRRSRQQ